MPRTGWTGWGPRGWEGGGGGEAPQIAGGAFAPVSLEAALWAFSRTDTFEQGALLVANLGDDADTTAAIYGMLAGAYYGEAALPPHWREKLFFAPLLVAAADALCEIGAAADAGGGEGGEGTEASQEAGPCRAAFDATLRMHLTLERGYRAMLARLSPGPGPPMAWPGGYRSVEAFEAETGALALEVEQLASELASSLPPAAAEAVRAAASVHVADYGRQWARDAQQLADSLARKPAVSAMLGQIRRA